MFSIQNDILEICQPKGMCWLKTGVETIAPILGSLDCPGCRVVV